MLLRIALLDSELELATSKCKDLEVALQKGAQERVTIENEKNNEIAREREVSLGDFGIFTL